MSILLIYLNFKNNAANSEAQLPFGSFKNLINMLQLIKIKNQGEKLTVPVLKNVEKYQWFVDKIASRRDLARIMQTVLKIIVIKKIVKFFIIIMFLYFVPILTTYNGTTLEKNIDDDDQFNIFTFISKYNDHCNCVLNV